MVSVITVNSAEHGLGKRDWASPETLDNALFIAGIFRSDAGAMPLGQIIVHPIGRLHNAEINAIVGALAVQRAILAILTCDPKPHQRQLMEDFTGLVGDQGACHKSMVDQEINLAQTMGVHCSPPTETSSYARGAVEKVLAETLSLISANTVEQLAVATDLSGNPKFQEFVPINMYFSSNLSRNAAQTPTDLPVWAQNAFAWLQSNPHAGDDRLNRYLSAYEKKPGDLETLLQTA